MNEKRKASDEIKVIENLEAQEETSVSHFLKEWALILYAF